MQNMAEIPHTLDRLLHEALTRVVRPCKCFHDAAAEYHKARRFAIYQEGHHVDRSDNDYKPQSL